MQNAVSIATAHTSSLVNKKISINKDSFKTRILLCGF